VVDDEHLQVPVIDVIMTDSICSLQLRTNRSNSSSRSSSGPCVGITFRVSAEARAIDKCN